MADCLQKESIIPSGAFDFAAYRGLQGKRLQDVKRDLSQESKILGRVVFPRSTPILGELDIEHPVQLIFDAPVASNYL